MTQQHVGQRLQFGIGIGAAGRVRRRVQKKPLGLRRNRLLELRRADLEARLHRAHDFDRRAAGEIDHVGIAHPVRRRDDDLVAGVQRRHEGVIEHLLAAGADRDLRGLVVEAVLALELGGDGGLELGDAVDIGVLRRTTFADRLDRGFLDVVRRVEVRLAGAQADDVAAGRFERARLVGHRDGRRRLDALEAVRNEGHGKLRNLAAYRWFWTWYRPNRATASRKE